MADGFFKLQQGYDERARKVVEEAAIKATARPWTPFYLVGVVLWDGRFLVLAVQGIGLA